VTHCPACIINDNQGDIVAMIQLLGHPFRCIGDYCYRSGIDRRRYILKRMIVPPVDSHEQIARLHMAAVVTDQSDLPRTIPAKIAEAVDGGEYGCKRCHESAIG
jgi:hypothetical protein